MKSWWSASELAGAVGMPTHSRHVARLARFRRWRSRQRVGRGGGREYHIDSLPPETQAALIDWFGGVEPKAADEIPAAVEEAREAQAVDEGLRALVQLTERRRDVSQIRLRIVRLAEPFIDDHGSIEGMAEFVRAYNAGAVEVEDHIRAAVPQVSVRTLARWRGAFRTQGAAALAGRYGGRKPEVAKDPELQRTITGLITSTPHITAAAIYAALEARFEPERIPSRRSVERWVRNWMRRNAQTMLALSNPDAWKNQYMTAFGDAAAGASALNAVWELDSTPADVLCSDGRYSLIGCIDVYSRRFKLRVARTSKAAEIAALIRSAIIDWGVPEAIRTDNGQDYVANHIVQICDSLGIKRMVTAPFSPEQKPFIERALGTFSHDLLELLPDFVGHNVAEREALRARKTFAERLFKDPERPVEVKMTAAELQDFCDRWLELYHGRTHAGLKCSPSVAVARWGEPIKVVKEVRLLDVLLEPAGVRTVGKVGISLDSRNYIAVELAGHIRERVMVRRDPVDLGRIYVYNADGIFICVAECPEVTGIDRRQIARDARRHQRELMAAARKELRKIEREAKLGGIVDEILRHKLAQEKVRTLPRPSVDHDSVGLRAAAAALKAAETAPPTPIIEPAELERRRQAFIAEQERPQAPIFDDPFQRAVWLWGEESKGRTLTGEETTFLAWYRTDKPRSYARAWELAQARFGIDDKGKASPGAAGLA